jgi:hypothetical protein
MGNADDGMRVAANLCQDAPDMKRNALVLAGLLASVGDPEAFERFCDLLRDVGL